MMFRLGFAIALFVAVLPTAPRASAEGPIFLPSVFVPGRCLGASQIVANGGFEQGTSPWILWGESALSSQSSASGSSSIRMGMSRPGFGGFYQHLSMPTEASSATASFRVFIDRTGPADGYAYTELWLNIHDQFNSLVAYTTVRGHEGSSSWHTAEVSLDNVPQIRGQTISIAFGVATSDASVLPYYPAAYFVDDVRIDVQCGTSLHR